MKFPPMSKTIERLPRDARGFPVPAFVHKPAGWRSGEPLDMRVLDVAHYEEMARKRLCGVCGLTLYSKVWFIGGPMCLLNRIFGDNGLHRDCAEFSLRVCPFLSRSTAHYGERPGDTERFLQDPNLVKQRPPYMVLLSTDGYGVLTHDPSKGVRLPKPLMYINPWRSCEFRNNDGTPTTDRYAVITNPQGTGLYCFDCIGKGKKAITFHPDDVERRYCPTCDRVLGTAVEPVVV